MAIIIRTFQNATFDTSKQRVIDACCVYPKLTISVNSYDHPIVWCTNCLTHVVEVINQE